MLKRRRISVNQAVAAIAVYNEIPIRLVDVDLEDALRLADRLSMYAYDAYLLCCAQRFEAPLLSLDRDLLAAAKEIGLSIVEVA